MENPPPPRLRNEQKETHAYATTKQHVEETHEAAKEGGKRLQRLTKEIETDAEFREHRHKELTGMQREFKRILDSDDFFEHNIKAFLDADEFRALQDSYDTIRRHVDRLDKIIAFHKNLAPAVGKGVVEEAAAHAAHSKAARKEELERHMGRLEGDVKNANDYVAFRTKQHMYTPEERQDMIEKVMNIEKRRDAIREMTTLAYREEERGIAARLEAAEKQLATASTMLQQFHRSSPIAQGPPAAKREKKISAKEQESLQANRPSQGVHTPAQQALLAGKPETTTRASQKPVGEGPASEKLQHALTYIAVKRETFASNDTAAPQVTQHQVGANEGLAFTLSKPTVDVGQGSYSPDQQGGNMTVADDDGAPQTTPMKASAKKEYPKTPTMQELIDANFAPKKEEEAKPTPRTLIKSLTGRYETPTRPELKAAHDALGSVIEAGPPSMPSQLIHELGHLSTPGSSYMSLGEQIKNLPNLGSPSTGNSSTVPGSGIGTPSHYSPFTPPGVPPAMMPLPFSAFGPPPPYVQPQPPPYAPPGGFAPGWLGNLFAPSSHHSSASSSPASSAPSSRPPSPPPGGHGGGGGGGGGHGGGGVHAPGAAAGPPAPFRQLRGRKRKRFDVDLDAWQKLRQLGLLW